MRAARSRFVVLRGAVRHAHSQHIGALLSAIGIAGMDRWCAFNVWRCRRAVEAGATSTVLLLDRPAPSVGNRLAQRSSRFRASVARGRRGRIYASDADRPRGRSIITGQEK